LVGYGKMGRNYHLPVLYDSLTARVVGIVRASKEAAAPSVPLYVSLEQALDKLQPDLVVISTPHVFHYEQTKMSLEHNCHVLVEKPLALCYSDAVHLVQLAEERERLLVVGLQRRYEGLACVFNRIVTEGRLGAIQLVHGVFAHRFSSLEDQNWRADPRFCGAGILDDSAYHLIDLLLCLAGGKVQDLSALALNTKDKALPHSFTCFFTTDSGATVSACGSYLSPVNSVQEEVSIWGTRGALFARRFCREWDTTPPQIFFKSADGREKKDYDLMGEPRGRELPLKTLLSVLAGLAPKQALLTEAKDTLETHRAIELIRESGKRNFPAVSADC
jgi:predicted dehydrogenase